MFAGDLIQPHHNNVAIAFEDNKLYSHEVLDGLANRFANHFRAIGLDAGDRVSFLMGNDPLLVAGYIGAFRAGFIANPLNNRLTPAELAYILGHAGSHVIVVGREFAALIEQTMPLLSTHPHVLVLGADLPPAYARSDERDVLASADTFVLQPPLDDEDGALLIYTSGTTGDPKGVMLSHRNVVRAVEYVRRGFRIGPSDRTLCVMPLFHTNGLMFSTLPFLSAGATVILRRRFSATRLWAQCRDERADSFSASPTILALLLEHEATAPPSSEIALKYIKVASAPTSVELARRFEARFGEGLLLETFGLTETTAITTMNPLEGPRKFGSIGKALPPQEVRIVDDTGRCVPAGETGEIEVRGETVMKGYYRDPDNTQKTFRDGWLCTGDLARMDEDGYVVMVGRAKEMIVRGGENISPLEVEAVVLRHPLVHEAAVVGLPDRIWGEIVGLFVVADPSIEAGDLIEHCGGALSTFKLPEVVHFVEELPRNAMGKVMRSRLAGLVNTSAPPTAEGRGA
ncbi:class I adenylate-forming enzyme family protein [Pararhizobium haloflavum]|uniref:class I adenylate-forming enzyme family protein n=1 Tax=Pararhizobium haloflavum TaxID=2037914 RepID=UPI002478027F